MKIPHKIRPFLWFDNQVRLVQMGETPSGSIALIDFELSAQTEAEACGWLKDRYGLSWQIIPIEMTDMMTSGQSEAVQRLTAAMLQMKKLDIATLRQAYSG